MSDAGFPFPPAGMWSPIHDIDWADAAVAELATTHPDTTADYGGIPQPVSVALTRCRACHTPLLIIETPTELLSIELSSVDGG